MPVEDISELWLLGCDAAAGRLVGGGRGCAAPHSPGGAEPRRMALHQLASMVCKDDYRGIDIYV